MDGMDTPPCRGALINPALLVYLTGYCPERRRVLLELVALVSGGRLRTDQRASGRSSAAFLALLGSLAVPVISKAWAVLSLSERYYRQSPRDTKPA